ncbi:hypothetical protein A9262_10715 [Vibrio splendidus]|nr:hypothetical protein A9262_10715 [Vibrio splendidus]
MLYVEGEDDVVFWEVVFEKTTNLSVKVESVDGVKELNKYIKKVIDDDIEGFVARDSDFTLLDEAYKSHPKVISTFGHSIENSIVCPNVLNKVIKSHGRLPSSILDHHKSQQWLDDFYNKFGRFVIYDAYNDIHQLGNSVLSDNCTALMHSQTSCNPCEVKVSSLYNKVSQSMCVEGFEITSKLQNAGRSDKDFVRGHFLFSGALKFVNHMISTLASKKKPSKDGFFGSSMLAFEAQFNTGHPHYNFYKDQIDGLN